MRSGVADIMWCYMLPDQDVGLIFLSSMATSIAAICAEQGYEDHEALGTALLTLALSTLLVGVLIMLVGAYVSSHSGLVTPLYIFLSCTSLPSLSCS